MLLLVGTLIAAGGTLGRSGAPAQPWLDVDLVGSITVRRSSGRRGAAAFPGLGGAGALGAATTGTVTSVSGSTLYVTNSSGNLVKVTVGPSATVNRNAKSSLASLQVGDTVVVQGSKATNGSVTATSVSATEAGVSSGFPGFGSGAGTGG